MPVEIPEVVIDRLPVYARALELLDRQGCEVVSSQELGDQLGVTPAQIRKDLSYFGRFGKQGRGYNIRRLAQQLQQILGLDRQWSMILVGVGHLGLAILAYDGFQPQGFIVVAAFDANPDLIGRKLNGTSSLAPKPNMKRPCGSWISTRRLSPTTMFPKRSVAMPLAEEPERSGSWPWTP